MFAASLVTLSLFAARALAQELTINSPETTAVSVRRIFVGGYGQWGMARELVLFPCELL